MPEILLLVAAKLSWRPTSRDKSMVELVASDGSARTLTICQADGVVSWAIVENLPPGFVPIVLTARAAEALRRGAPLSLRFDGAGLHADVAESRAAV